MNQLSLNDIPWTDKVGECIYYYVFLDGFPVTEGHTLFVPKVNNARHISTCFEAAYAAGSRMVENGTCDAFNVGMNVGLQAGQTVMWPHIHLIPRRTGDTLDPRGGVRGVIADKQKY